MDGTIVSLELNLNVVTKRPGAGMEIKNEITFGGRCRLCVLSGSRTEENYYNRKASNNPLAVLT